MPILPDTDNRQQIALGHLRLCREELEQARRSRALYVDLARKYGLSNQAIGEALGITEAGVRRIMAGS